MRLKGLEFWQAAVFCSGTASGNPTGVLFATEVVPDETCQLLAELLGFPDTVFLDQGQGPFEWNARTFSPSEKISFCVQTLLASDSVLRARFALQRQAEFWFNTGERRISPSFLAESPDVTWVTIPHQQITLEPDQIDYTRAIRVPVTRFPALLIGAGRKRVYQRLPDATTLYSVVADPQRVFQYCKSESIQGICLFALNRDRELALRVFTTSLDGREDSATGGAVSGLFAYLEQVGSEGLNLESVWTVQQGHGPRHSRGTLFVRRVGDGKDVAVGGRTILLARGNLCDVDFELEEAC